MKIEDLEIFQEVAQCLSFSTAADNLFMAQSSVSKAIKRLEDELDIFLFTRKHASIELTLSGKELLEHCGSFLNEYHSMIRKVQGASDVHHITLVESIPLMKFNLPELFAQFRAAHPNILLEVLHYEFLEDAVKEIGSYPNLFLTYFPQQYEPLYYFEPLYQDQLVALIPNHNTEDPNEISLHDLVSKKLFITSNATRQLLLNYCHAHGLVPDIVYISEGPRREIAMRNAANGYGIAICYRSDISIYKLNFLGICSIKEFPATSVCIGIKRDHSITHYEQILVSLLISYSQNSTEIIDF